MYLWSVKAYRSTAAARPQLQLIDGHDLLPPIVVAAPVGPSSSNVIMQWALEPLAGFRSDRSLLSLLG